MLMLMLIIWWINLSHLCFNACDFYDVIKSYNYCETLQNSKLVMVIWSVRHKFYILKFEFSVMKQFDTRSNKRR